MQWIQVRGRKNKVTIKNENGRLSKDEITRMVSEAEEFREVDKKNRELIEAKNSLENYIYQVKNTLTDSKVNFSEEDKLVVSKVCEETITWLGNHQNETVEVYKSKQTDVEGVIAPIMTKLYKDSSTEEGDQSGL